MGRVAIKGWLEHVRNCRVIRRLLAEHDSDHLRNLYWYDLRLADAVRWRGILKVLGASLFARQRDEIAANYAIEGLYYAEPEGDGLTASRATVWQCKGLGTRPWFDESNDTRKALERHAEEIVAEYRSAADLLDTHPDNRSLTGKGRWSGMFFYGAGGVRNEALCRRCPTTARVLDGLPLCKAFGFAMFSGIEPRTHIEAHSGSSNLRLRHHLGVDVPEPAAGRLRVGTEWRTWKQNGTLAFDDSYEHEVVHEGARDRVVLVVDVWHPSLTEEEIRALSHPVFQRFGKRAPAVSRAAP